jgi:hypothetical protein
VKDTGAGLPNCPIGPTGGGTGGGLTTVRMCGGQVVQQIVTSYQLAVQAMRELRLPLPDIRTAPPRGSDGLVGLRHFYWVDRAQWRPHVKRVQAGGVWAQVTATPTRLVIAPGDGTKLTCAGPGAPYDLSRAPEQQASSCVHTYQRSSAGLAGSAYRVSASVVWSAVWIGSDGAGGVLAPVTVTATFGLRVAEGQALVDGR